MDPSRLVSKASELVATSPERLKVEVEEFCKKRANLSKKHLAEAWANRIVRLFTSQGVVTALPGVAPVQLGGEVDLGFMLWCMARMVGGMEVIYGHDIQEHFTQDFIRVLAYWCGVLIPVRETNKRLSQKAAVAFNEVTAHARINRRVSTTILTEYGAKRERIAVGRLAPLRVVVGGWFNWATMQGFKRKAIAYFNDDLNLAVAEDHWSANVYLLHR